MAQVEAGDEAHEVELDAFDPAELDAQEPAHRRLDAGAAVGQAGIGPGRKSLPTAFDGSVASSSGTARRTVAVKVLLFGPGQTR